jgi:hypothetical protein
MFECQQQTFQVIARLRRDGINPYALDFPICTEGLDDNAPLQDRGNDGVMAWGASSNSDSVIAMRALHSPSSQALHLLRHTRDGPPFLPPHDKFIPCEEFYFTNYLNRPDVREALHVKPDIRWVECTDALDYSREDFAEPQIELYKSLVQKGVEGKHELHILVFSGDDDAVCALEGTQEWIYTLGVEPMENKFWKPWKVLDQFAGFVTYFDLGDKTNATFTFATVHGAGHEVPSYRPMEAFELFKNYLTGKW